MSAVKWFSGPPPAVGWWPIHMESYSWWNGERWSIPVHKSVNDPAVAGCRAKHKNTWSHKLLWRHWSIEIDGTDGKGAHL